MAIEYTFSCPNCNYQERLIVGLSKVEHYKKYPDKELGSCDTCKSLSITQNKRCSTCRAKAETSKWFSKKTGFKILDSSMMMRDTKIPCPKCYFRFLDATPIMYID